MRILVTGGGGFIGKNVVKKLVELNHEVTIVAIGDEKSPNTNVIYASLEGINWDKVKGYDAVVHQMANNDTRCLDEEEMWRANVSGPITLFQKAYAGGCRKFVYASSTAVYGNSPAPYTEETLVAPLNPYGRSKAEFDKFAMLFGEYTQSSVIGLRYCNVYGPGEEFKGKRMSMIGQLMRQVRKGLRLKLFKDGSQKRDWIYVDDVVQTNVLALLAPQTSIYNIGSGTSISFNDLISLIYKQYQKEGPLWIEYIDCPFSEEYQSFTECNIEKARKELGFSPGFDLQSGIAAYFNYLVSCSSCIL